MTGRAPVVIDTDGGVDDAVALWWALTDPTLDVLAVTVVAGNVSLAAAAGSVLRVLHAAGRREVPVALGESGPIGRRPALRIATFIHGEDGLGNAGPPAPSDLAVVAEPASELLERVVAERPGEITLVTLGPLSTVGRLVAASPGVAARLREVVVMGGSARRGGNALPAAEANIAHDPAAAQAVVEAPWVVPPLLVGLDVTHTATLSHAEFQLLEERRTPAAAFLAEPLAFYRRFASTATAPGCPCHDLLAVLAAAHPGLVVDAPVLPLAVDTAGGAAWGATVVDFRAAPRAVSVGDAEMATGGGAGSADNQPTPTGFAPWRIALDVDVDGFRRCVRQLFGDPAR
jgi:purine nucleosidase